jgi:uncharacterized protein with FMN-binding domain
MRTRATASLAGFALAVLLLVNFKGPTDPSLVVAVTDGSSTTGSSTTGSSRGSTTGTTGTTSGSSGSGSTGSSTTGSGSSSASSGTYTGTMIGNPFGEVQVQITVSNGKITDVQALALPVGGHSGRISNYVAPILRTQALTAQSANIDGISGATYTSRAYAASLQSAIDQAGL